MKRNLLANILLLAFSALLTTPFAARAITSLTMEVETGAQVDKATAIVKDVKEGGQVIVPQFKDTNFLFTGEPMSSLVIYNTAASNGFFMVTAFGDDIVEISAENIGEGDFVVVNTAEPDGCTTLTLAECRAQSDYIGETTFSVTKNPPTIDIIDSGATPLAPLPDSAPVDSTSTPEATPVPVIQENGDGSTTFIAI